MLSQKITLGSSASVITQSYSYDSLNRLTSVQESVSLATRWAQNYSYDRFGHRTSLSNTGTEAGLLPTQSTPAVSASSNRLTGYSYDLAGNVTSDGAGNTFSYDAENRQIMHVRAGVSDTTYSYDGDGRRVKKTDAAGTTVFVYDAMGKLVAEYTTASVQGSGTSYITQDHLGSTRVVTDSSRAVKARHDYMLYGEEINAGIGSRTGPQGYVADNIRQKFTGKERDSESGLDYFLARYYSSAQGRFTSPDPENAGASPSDAQSWNGYAYSRSNPLNYVDPDGMKYRLTDTNGNSIDNYSDRDFNKNFRHNSDIELKNGSIYQGGELIGRYERLSFDDLGPYANQLYQELSSRRKASLQAVGGFAVVTGAVGATGGAAAYFGGVALGGNSITALGLQGTAEAATAAEVGSVLAQAASIVGNQGMRVGSRAAAEQAAKKWVGQGARAIVSRQTGQIIGKISADGTKIARYTSASKAKPYINLVNKVTGGNLHVYF